MRIYDVCIKKSISQGMVTDSLQTVGLREKVGRGLLVHVGYAISREMPSLFNKIMIETQ